MSGKGKEAAGGKGKEAAGGSEDVDSDSPLVVAIKSGNEEAFADLMTTLETEGVQEEVAQALWWAITLERAEFAEPLIFTIVQEGLLHAGHVVQLLCYAAWSGFARGVRAFLDADSSLVGAVEGVSGKSVLDYAVEGENDSVVELLRSRGAVHDAERHADRAYESSDVDEVEQTVPQPTLLFSANFGSRHSTPQNPSKGDNASTARASAADDDDISCASTEQDSSEENSPAVDQSSAEKRNATVSQSSSLHCSPTAAVADLLNSGDSIAQCHIMPCKEAGSGSFGVVQAGMYRGRLVAVKQQKKVDAEFPGENDTSRLTEFAREARILRVFQEPTHKHCLGFLGLGIDTNSEATIVTEYVGGGTLRRALRHTQIEPIERLILCAGLASGLAYIHETGVVHGDIKPANILLADGPDKSAKIIDFGGAYPYWRGPTAFTRLYAAPEVLAGRVTEARSDVFSLACVVYEVLSGKRLNKARVDDYALLPVAVDEGATSANVVDSRLDPALQGRGLGALLCVCWSEHASDRPRSGEFCRVLLAILAGECVEEAASITAAYGSATSCGNSRLMEAVLYEDVEAVKSLISQGERADHQNRWGHTPLHVAAAVGNVAIARHLLRDEPLLLEDSFGTSPVDLAIAAVSFVNGENEQDMLSLLKISDRHRMQTANAASEQAVPDIRVDPDGALRLAAARGDVGRAQLLLNRGVSFLASGAGTTSALQVAVAAGSVGIVDLFLSHSTVAGFPESTWCGILEHAYEHATPAVMARILAFVPQDSEVLVDSTWKQLTHSCRHKSAEWVRALVEFPPLVEGGEYDWALQLWAISCGLERWDVVRALLGCEKFSPTAEDSEVSALRYACACGHELVAGMILARGVDINAQTSDGTTALMSACEHRHVSMVVQLVECGADVGLSNDSGANALSFAFVGESEEVIPYLLAACGDQRTEISLKTLAHAAASGLINAVQYLFADVEPLALVPALYRASACGHLSVVEFLLSAIVNVSQDVLCACLIHACEGGHVDVVQTILGQGRMNRWTDSHSTAIVRACGNGHAAVVELLAEGEIEGRSANWCGPALSAACNSSLGSEVCVFRPDTQETMSVTEEVCNCATCRNLRVIWECSDKPSTWAAELVIASCNGDTRYVRVLLSVGATANSRGNDGVTPLCAACDGGHEDIVRILLEAGASPNAVSGILEEQTRPLTAACERGDTDIVRMLLEYDADVNAPGPSRGHHAALIAACTVGETSTVQLLLENGADVHEKDWRCRSAFFLALLNGHLEVVDLLVSEGAEATHRDICQMCAEGEIDLVRLLFDSYRADVNSFVYTWWNEPWAPLISASGAGQRETVALLLRLGAQLLERDIGAYALREAIDKGHDDVAALLREHGVKKPAPSLSHPLTVPFPKVY